jgi:hypothetical protein
LRIAARLKSSGLEARFEGFRGVERDLKDFRGVFISDVETQTPDCVHTMTLVDNADRRLFLLLGPFSAGANPGFVFCLLSPGWSSFLSPKIRLSEPFEAWTIVWMLEIRRFLSLRECSPLLFSIVLFQIFGDSSVSGSALVALGHIALLEGVCWNIGKLCEHAQCARSSDSRYILHLELFLGVF